LCRAPANVGHANRPRLPAIWDPPRRQSHAAVVRLAASAESFIYLRIRSKMPGDSGAVANGYFFRIGRSRERVYVVRRRGRRERIVGYRWVVRHGKSRSGGGGRRVQIGLGGRRIRRLRRIVPAAQETGCSSVLKYALEAARVWRSGQAAMARLPTIVTAHTDRDLELVRNTRCGNAGSCRTSDSTFSGRRKNWRVIACVTGSIQYASLPASAPVIVGTF